jgi:subtilisin family serine protease
MNEQRPQETTGRFLVTLKEEAAPDAPDVLGRALGIEDTVRVEGAGPSVAEQAAGQAVVFERLGVAVVAAPPEQAREMGVAAQEEEAIVQFEPERVVYTYEATSPPEDKKEDATWGLQAIGIDGTSLTGEGVEVAVLDTGVALDHPDLVGRDLASQSFVPGEEVEDLHGHGTHCIGTACGSVGDAIRPRYGVAPGARIFAGKVLSNRGSGTDTGILAGIEAAIDRGCRVVSLSLGAPTSPGAPYSEAFEKTALRARAAGTLLVAAAGNDSNRPAELNPVSHPANCPSILAVAAVDESHAVARFSNQGGGPLGGGKVDIAGPGVDVYSMAPMPTRYSVKSGTSMATPHVAGAVALLAQANPAASPDELATALLSEAAPLSAPADDVGAGLVQAPK